MSTLKMLEQNGKPPQYVALSPEMSKTALVENEHSSLASQHTKFAIFIDSAEASVTRRFPNARCAPISIRRQ
jgi:hypothetical protein